MNQNSEERWLPPITPGCRANSMSLLARGSSVVSMSTARIGCTPKSLLVLLLAFDEVIMCPELFQHIGHGHYASVSFVTEVCNASVPETEGEERIRFRKPLHAMVVFFPYILVGPVDPARSYLGHFDFLAAQFRALTPYCKVLVGWWIAADHLSASAKSSGCAAGSPSFMC